MKILLIDDDEKLCRLIGDYLEPMGYQIDAAHTGQQGLMMIENEDYHAVILDVMMPGMDGFQTLQQLRRMSDVPVLMMTARDGETDRIVGLEMGADDYLPKTFSSRELLARLRAVTRRYQKTETPATAGIGDNALVFGALRIDPDSHSAILDGSDLCLTPIEYDLLYTLAQAAGRALSRDQLLDSVAGRDYDTFDRSVDVHVSSLRRKLGEDPRNPRYIRTIRSVGYLFKKESGD
jgi:two-component system response regulator CpxR